jgi:predicted outer membrane repeat protein
VLVGFTLRYGSAFRGGGVLCEYSSPRITDCAIHSNEALSDGGGIYARECGPIVENCRVEGNNAINHSGGGFAVRLGSPRITGCAFIRNLAHEEGGAIFCEDASPVITDNVIDDNTSTVTYAGGIMSRNCTAVVARNVISNNDTYGIGGGMFY